ncbi:hypothetical protein RFI_15818 [Reticulomyxa filosa]|uniref:G domain-containing protein n=1 Tax=Reticulomyxa filosa TaxID=46433 RepID=X6N5X8_RETFI|nr:hypothetical protein RFI_15818 [Reticulomyxa filosa]|eukprot:ETO21386.1 hypothetical protein RFI_15818 [Reticulomyxa filosa]
MIIYQRHVYVYTCMREQTEVSAQEETCVLLLGTAASGKSTLLNHTRLLYGDPARMDPKKFVQAVYAQILGALDLIIAEYKANTLQNSKFPTINDQKVLESIEYLEEYHKRRKINRDNNPIDVHLDINFEMRPHLWNIWNNRVIQYVYHHNTKHFSSSNHMSLQYFMKKSKLNEISQPDYLPSEKDILMLRQPTKGLMEDRLRINELQLILGHSFFNSMIAQHTHPNAGTATHPFNNNHFSLQRMNSTSNQSQNANSVHNRLSRSKNKTKKHVRTNDNNTNNNNTNNNNNNNNNNNSNNNNNNVNNTANTQTINPNVDNQHYVVSTVTTMPDFTSSHLDEWLANQSSQQLKNKMLNLNIHLNLNTVGSENDVLGQLKIINMDEYMSPYRIFDVGGHREERQHWAKYLTGLPLNIKKQVSVVVFTADCVAFDMDEKANEVETVQPEQFPKPSQIHSKYSFMAGKGASNPMIESLNLWREILESKPLQHCIFVLVLTRNDLLKDKIEKKKADLSKCFPDYKYDPNDEQNNPFHLSPYEHALDYIIHQYLTQIYQQSLHRMEDIIITTLNLLDKKQVERLWAQVSYQCRLKRYIMFRGLQKSSHFSGLAAVSPFE